MFEDISKNLFLFFGLILWYEKLLAEKHFFALQISHVMRKRVFGDLRPGKTQTGLLRYGS